MTFRQSRLVAHTDRHSIDSSCIAGKVMAGDRSLRSQVEKLIGSTRGQAARVRLLERTRSGGTCRVCIQIDRPTGTFSLFFFSPCRRHVARVSAGPAPSGGDKPQSGLTVQQAEGDAHAR
ncbi:hypothetical protein OKW45_001122 [Paraburkholderia sp. WSM4175]